MANAPEKWKNDGILNLEGVPTLSFDELTTKLEETASIHDAITDEVASQAQCTCHRLMEHFL